MSSIELPQLLPFQPARLSVQRYHQLVQVGAFDEHDAVELLDGVVVEKKSKNPPHRLATRKCDLLLSAMVPQDWHVQNQEPITLETSEPEPDVAIVRGKLSDYAIRHPGSQEVGLVVEVADTTVVTDRYKAELYARAAIPCYWLVNLLDDSVEVRTLPEFQTDRYQYAHCQRFGMDDTLVVTIGDRTIGHLNVRELFQ